MEQPVLCRRERPLSKRRLRLLDRVDEEEGGWKVAQVRMDRRLPRVRHRHDR